MPSRTRSCRAPGCRIAPAELARCLTSGSSPAWSASANASSNAAICAALAGCCGSSEQARCDQSPVTRMLPSCSAVCAACTSDGHSERGAPPRDRPVSNLICTRATRPAPTGGVDDLLELTDRVGRDVDVGVDQVPVVRAGRRQPAEQPPGVACASQGQRLVARGHPEPLRAGRAGRACHREHPVAVGVGLDHDHQLRTGRAVLGDQLPQPPHVVPDRTEVDDDLGVRTRWGRHERTIFPFRGAGSARPPAPRRPRILLSTGHHLPRARPLHRAATTRPPPRPTDPDRPPAASR